MAPDPRASKAISAMRALGIPDEEVKPVLEQLLEVYDKNWELIEEDNFRTLIDAYFELKEGRRDAMQHTDEFQISTRGLHSEEGEDWVSPAIDNSKLTLPVEKDEISSKVSELDSLEPSQRCLRDSRAVALARLSNDSTGNAFVKAVGSHYQHLYNEQDSSACNERTRTRTCFNIASSPLGEVKISLNCDSALQKRNFHIPKLETVMRFVEEKYLKSYQIDRSKFSVTELLGDLCESYLKLGTGASDGSITVNSSSSMIIDECDALHGKRPKKRAFGVHNIKLDSSQGSDSSGHKISNNMIYEAGMRFYSVHDITKGAEKVKISLVYENSKECLPKFNYLPHNIIYQNAHINISLARIVDEDCCSGCSGDCLSSLIPCACACETGGEFAYSPQGLLKEEFLTSYMSIKKEPQAHHFVYCQDCPLERTKNEYKPERCKGHLVERFIKECWRKCGCDMLCGNRIVQRGITCKLQVFLTPEGKGWGLRTLEDLPKGAFVCEYVGEVLTNMELYERILRSNGNERHTYPVTLDADWGSEGILRDEEALCLDATCHGNVARFINHRCFDANLVDIPVEVETPDRHYYHVAFFTTRKVCAFEELTWDYGIDFDDLTHPIKAFRCSCGSASCRDLKQKGIRKEKS